MQYHVLLTERCNFQCTYCGGTRDLPGLPLDMTYRTEDLARFIGRDPDAIVGFYGGEPLLAMDRLREVMDQAPAKGFTLQTNGSHLKNLDDEHLKRLHSILISIDGDRERTDRCRGEGTYDTVMENLVNIRERGYHGDVIARMAFSKGGDIYRDVTHLLTRNDPHFDHVHWQLDVFWSDIDSWEDFNGWLERYEEGISRLIGDFSSGLEEGRVLGMVPFIPVLGSMVYERPTQHIRCGSGMSSFAVMTNGDVDVCPIAPELPYSKVGDIFTSDPQTLRGTMPVGEPCTDCDVLGICGGRCLFANVTKGWGNDLYDRVCLTTKRMIGGLRALVPRVRELIGNGTLGPDTFDYPKINNGCEIIP